MRYAVLIVVLMTSIAVAEEPPKEVKLMLDAMESQRAEAVSTLLQIAKSAEKMKGKRNEWIKQHSENRAKYIEEGGDFLPKLFIKEEVQTVGTLRPADSSVTTRNDHSLTIWATFRGPGWNVEWRIELEGIDNGDSYHDGDAFKSDDLFQFVKKDQEVIYIKPFDKKPFDEWRKAHPVEEKKK